VTLGISHDLDTGCVVLIDSLTQTMYEFSPARAHQLAAQLRISASSGNSVFVVGVADDGREFKVGGSAEIAAATADDIDRNADLGMTIRVQRHRSDVHL
jgi:GTPase